MSEGAASKSKNCKIICGEEGSIFVCHNLSLGIGRNKGRGCKRRSGFRVLDSLHLTEHLSNQVFGIGGDSYETNKTEDQRCTRAILQAVLLLLSRRAR